MTRYTIIGILDLLFGIPLVLQSLAMSIFTIPKLLALYSDSGIDIATISIRTYISLIIIAILGTINLFFGFKLFSSPTKEKYFKFGLASALISFALFGVLVGSLVLSVILPIYQLTTSF